VVFFVGQIAWLTVDGRRVRKHEAFDAVFTVGVKNVGGSVDVDIVVLAGTEVLRTLTCAAWW